MSAFFCDVDRNVVFQSSCRIFFSTVDLYWEILDRCDRWRSATYDEIIWPDKHSGAIWGRNCNGGWRGRHKKRMAKWNCSYAAICKRDEEWVDTCNGWAVATKQYPVLPLTTPTTNSTSSEGSSSNVISWDSGRSLNRQELRTESMRKNENRGPATIVWHWLQVQRAKTTIAEAKAKNGNFKGSVLSIQ